MFSVAAEVWNAIASTQELATRWAREVFALEQEALAARLEEMRAELEEQGQDPDVALAYLEEMPLLAESRAISAWISAEDDPDLRQALPEVASVAEAQELARMDYALTPTQERALARLLEKPVDPLWMAPEKGPSGSPSSAAA